MKKEYFQRPIAAIILLAVLFCNMAGKGIYAKYVRQEKLTGNIKITANIGSINVYEHEALRQEDGSYILDQNTVIDGSDEKEGNSYILLPGLDVLKDPWVEISKPNDLPVFIYVIIDENPKEDGITWIMTDQWVRLKEVEESGKDSFGWVYVYTGGTSNPLIVNKTMDEEKIAVFKDDTLLVSHFLLQPDTNGGISSEVKISITAHMFQVPQEKMAGLNGDGDDKETLMNLAAEVFNLYYNSQN